MLNSTEEKENGKHKQVGETPITAERILHFHEIEANSHVEPIKLNSETETP